MVWCCEEWCVLVTWVALYSMIRVCRRNIRLEYNVIQCKQLQNTEKSISQENIVKGVVRVENSKYNDNDNNKKTNSVIQNILAGLTSIGSDIEG